MHSRIYLIRHGITEGNQKRWFYGSADIPLAEEGRLALQSMVRRGVYASLPDDADFYTTGLLRTEETFGILFGEKSHHVIEELKEMAFGEFECKAWDELKDYPVFAKWAEDTTGDALLPGGESRNDFIRRVSLGLKKLTGQHRLKEMAFEKSGRDVISAIVCHGGVISAVMQELFPGERKSMWDWMVEPGWGYMVDFHEGTAQGYKKICDSETNGII